MYCKHFSVQISTYYFIELPFLFIDLKKVLKSGRPCWSFMQELIATFLYNSRRAIYNMCDVTRKFARNL